MTEIDDLASKDKRDLSLNRTGLFSLNPYIFPLEK